MGRKMRRKMTKMTKRIGIADDVKPAGHAAYAQRLAEVVERYETGNSGGPAGPAPHPTTSDLPSNLVLLNDDGQRVYTVTFPTSTFFENNTGLLFLHTL